MTELFFLSESSHNWFRVKAGAEGYTIGQYISLHHREWTSKKLVIKDLKIVSLIEGREGDRERAYSDSVVERGDKRKPKYWPNSLYDGTVWNAIFKGRRVHRYVGIDMVAFDNLVEWMRDSDVVRKRAATDGQLVSQALELIGRQWIE